MKNILITGYTGFLGQYLCQQATRNGLEVFGLSRKFGSQSNVKQLQIDLTSDQVLSELESLPINGIIHLAANGNVGDCEKYPEKSRLINVQASTKLAEFARKKQIPFVFTSSDQVFDGSKGGYSISDEARPLNQYGKQKLEAEQSILKCYPQAVVCRMPLMIGAQGGYEKAFVRNLKAGKKQTLFTDEIRSVLPAEEAAKKLLEALNWAAGLYHLPGPKDMTRYELGIYLAKKHGLDLSLIQAGKQSDLKLSVKRPKNATMI